MRAAGCYTDGSTVSVNSMCHEIWGQFFNQLWPSDIRKKPSQTCAHFSLYILLFMEAHLRKLNSPHFTEKWHFLCTICKTNKYPLQKTWFFPMTSRSYTCFLKGICKCVAHWFGLVYTARVWHSAHVGRGGTLEGCAWRKQSRSPECMFGGILQHDQSYPTSHNSNIWSRVLQHMRICNG